MNKYGTFWRRFWAGCVDSIVFTPLIVLNFLMIYKAATLPVFVFALWYTVHSFLWYAYSIWMHGKYGQTLGKMALKVKVMDVSESRQINFRQAFMRDAVPVVFTIVLLPHELIQIVRGTSYILHKEASPDVLSIIFSFVVMGWFLLEVITMLSNSKRRAIHDFIAKSVVIKV
jgi:uncharacterized RDD family membrane protein YckC